MAGRKLWKSTGIISLFTLMSRILGLVRDMVIAQVFGASAPADAFFVAFKIPNFLRRLFAEGAFAQAFVPVLSEYKSQRGHDPARQLIDRVAGDLGLVLAALSVLAVLTAPYVVVVFAPGFVKFPEKLALAGQLLQWTFPYLFFISMTALAGSILNTYNRFGAPAFAPVLLNLCMISSALWLAPRLEQPVYALGVAVLVAGAMQMVLQVPFLIQENVLPRPKLDWGHEGVRRILKLMAPALFGVSVGQINLLLDTVLASFLVTGSVSWLYYSDRLMELPLGLIGIAIGTVILPSLSEKHAAESTQAFSQTLDWALRVVLLAGVPAAVALFILAEPIIATLFLYREFTDNDVVKTAMSLRAYTAGVLGFMLVKVLSPGYFSRQDMKTPVKIGVYAMIANMVFNLILVWPLQHAGLALATSISSFVNAGLLLAGLLRAGVYQREPGWLRFGAQMVVATAAMAAAVFALYPDLQALYQAQAIERALILTKLVVAGMVAYFGALWVLGVRARQFLLRV